jgi:hypothetical protein
MREKPMTESVCKYIRGGLAAAFAMAVLPLASPSAQAADYDVGSIHITQPWTRATPKGASSGAGYLTVTNSGTAPDRLTCAGTDVADTMAMENGVMKMRPVERGLDWLREEVVAILVISHTACFLLGGSIGFLFAAICVMASDKYPQGRYECRGATAEDQIVSDQARLTSLPPRMAPLLRMPDNESPSR